MSEATDESALGQGALSAVKKAIPWVLLVVVAFRVWGLYGDFQQASLTYTSDFGKPKSALIATPTVDGQKPGAANDVVPPKPVDQVQALTGVNVHKDASGSSETLFVLDTGQRLRLVDQVGPWYKVKDAKGKTGWVTASHSYTKVIKAK